MHGRRKPPAVAFLSVIEWPRTPAPFLEKLNDNTPDGCIKDVDTILVDLIEENDFEFFGFAHDIFNIWKNSSDKEAVEQMFYEFTDISVKEYLEKCKREISR